MDILISNKSDKPLYEQITIQIKQMIMNNTLKEGDPLPSMRTLAKDLRISLITTKRAYEELEREGFIETFTGKGSFVASKDKQMFLEEQYRQIEEALSSACTMAKMSNISKEELQDILNILYEGGE